jgi:D-3-phosphoglycerate dehydrogenase
MTATRIVATAPIDQVAIDILQEVAPVETSPAPDEESMMRHLDNTIGIVCRGEGVVTARMIEACPALRVIGRSGVGYDSVDVAAATARRIPLVYAPVGGFAVAEGALAMLLTLVKKVPLCDAIVKSDQWNKRYEFNSGDMTGHTLGIVGLGRIGSQLARLVQNFSMKVLAFDPIATSAQAKELGIELVELDEVIRTSDFISLHVPLTGQTKGMINRESIATMKKGAILVNLARGGVIENLDVLADGLESGQLAGVGLDVFPEEPPDVSHRIFKDPRCVCAPHLLGTSELAMERIFTTMATGMVAVLQGNRPEHCVNPDVF